MLTYTQCDRIFMFYIKQLSHILEDAMETWLWFWQ